MNDLLDWYRGKSASADLNPILFATEFHYRFIRIHPFDDGNGRTARILSILEIYDTTIDKVFKEFLVSSEKFDRFYVHGELTLYDKKNYRKSLKDVFGNRTLKQVSVDKGVDILVTSKDITDNEETFFTSFNTAEGIKGTYQDALVRTVLEATMSAPTYFSPLERFIDGGATTYNNPSLAALMEAVRYDGKGKYTLPNITLFSFGTGRVVKSVSPQNGANPPGIDAYFWLNYIMDESSQDASSMQNDLFRAGMMEMDFRRYQISLDTAAVKKLPDMDISGIAHTNADRLHDLTDHDLEDIALDDVSRFDLVKVIGDAMTEYIMTDNKFQRDLNNTPSRRDELVTAFENINTIKSMITSADWLDNKVGTA